MMAAACPICGAMMTPRVNYYRTCGKPACQAEAHPPSDTPWGRADFYRRLFTGVWYVATPSHEGYWLSPERLLEVPEAGRTTPFSPGQWFEGDVDSLIIYATFYDQMPELAKHYPTRATLIECLRKWNTGRGSRDAYFSTDLINALEGATR